MGYNGRMDRRHTLPLIIVLVMLAACSGAPPTGQLPTAFQLVTQAPAGPTAVERPTLPPPFTETPTLTVTLTETPTITLTVTPSLTITDTPTPTATLPPTSTPADQAVMGLVDIGLHVTVLPTMALNNGFTAGQASGGPTPGAPPAGGTISCPAYPSGGFNSVFTNNPGLAQQLGCPQGNPPVTLTMQGVSQVFERGVMIWLQGAPPWIYVFQSDGTFLRFDDTFNASVDPNSGGETAPVPLLEPVRGFGKVWRANPAVRASLGWAVSEETAGQATVQPFANGRMIYLTPRSDVLVLIESPGGTNGRWQSAAGSF